MHRYICLLSHIEAILWVHIEYIILPKQNSYIKIIRHENIQYLKIRLSFKNIVIFLFISSLNEHWEEKKNVEQNQIVTLNSKLHVEDSISIYLVKVKVAQSCLTLFDPMDYPVHGILQARILEWVAFPFSRGSSQPWDWTQVSCIAGRFFTSWATREASLYLLKAHVNGISLDVSMETKGNSRLFW